MKAEQMNDAVELIYDAVEAHGLVQTINAIFGSRVKVVLPFSKSSYEVDIEALELSVRSTNCLRRGGISTVEQLIDSLQSEDLRKYRNLGAKSFREIQTKMLAYAYQVASPQRRREIIEEIIKKNCQ